MDRRSGNLFWTQPRHGIHGPGQFVSLRNIEIRTTISTKRSGPRNHGNQTFEVITVFNKVIRKQLEAWRKWTVKRQVIHGVHQRSSEQQSPDAVHHGPRKGSVFPMRQPFRKSFTTRPLRDQQISPVRNRYRHHSFLLRIEETVAILHRFFRFLNASQRRRHARKKGGELVKILLSSPA